LRAPPTAIGDARSVSLLGLALYLFFSTNLGTAMRATGDNPQMIRALGVSVDFIIILGLALSNGLIALSDPCSRNIRASLTCKWASAWLYGAWPASSSARRLFGSARIGLLITACGDGVGAFSPAGGHCATVGLDPNDLKLITAAFVFRCRWSPRRCCASSSQPPIRSQPRF